MHEFGDGFNPLNYEYEKSPRGPALLESEHKKQKLVEVRKQNMEFKGQPIFNPINHEENTHAEHKDPDYSKNHEKARMELKKGEVFAGKPNRSVSRRMLSGTGLMSNEVPLERR